MNQSEISLVYRPWSKLTSKLKYIDLKYVHKPIKKLTIFKGTINFECMKGVWFPPPALWIRLLSTHHRTKCPWMWLLQAGILMFSPGPGPRTQHRRKTGLWDWRTLSQTMQLTNDTAAFRSWGQEAWPIYLSMFNRCYKAWQGRPL